MQSSASLTSSYSFSDSTISTSTDGGDAAPTSTTSTSSSASISSSISLPAIPPWRMPSDATVMSRNNGNSTFILVPKKMAPKKMTPKKRSSKPNRPKVIETQPSQKSLLHPSKKKPGKFSSCFAGICADCIAICCCPLSLLHLLALVLFKLPAATARKVIKSIKRLCKKTSCSVMDTQDKLQQPSILHPCNSLRQYFTEEVVDQVSLEFKDEKFLREYFECKQLIFGALD